MHVLMLIYNYWPGSEGGTERQCRRLAKELVRRQINVTVLTSRSSSAHTVEEMDEGVRIIRVPVISPRVRERAVKSPSAGSGRAGRNITRLPWTSRVIGAVLRGVNIVMFMKGARRFIRNTDIDVIHVHTTTWIAGFGAYMGRLEEVPVICKESTYPAFPRTPPIVPLRGYWQRLRLTNVFLAQHGDAAESLECAGVPRSRIHVVPNGVKLPEMQEKPAGGMNVLFVGNLTQGLKDKGLDILTAAWEIVARREPCSKLTIAGAGDTLPILSWAEENGISSQVECLGFVRDVSALYRSHDVVVIPSRREGMSNVLLEAMSWGVPVVASDIPGNRAVVRHEVTGFLAPVDAPHEMAGYILSLLLDNKLKRSISTAAQAAVREHFSMDVVVNQMITLYKNITASFPGAGCAL